MDEVIHRHFAKKCQKRAGPKWVLGDAKWVGQEVSGWVGCFLLAILLEFADDWNGDLIMPEHFDRRKTECLAPQLDDVNALFHPGYGRLQSSKQLIHEYEQTFRHGDFENIGLRALNFISGVLGGCISLSEGAK